jgi:signal transduction histidine kinase
MSLNAWRISLILHGSRWRASCNGRRLWRVALRPAACDRISLGTLQIVSIFLRVIRYWAISALLATAMMLFTAFQTNMQFHLRGQEMSYFSSMLWSAVIWYTWAFLAPLPIMFALRYPIEKDRPGFARTIALHVVLGAAFIGLHAVIAAAIMYPYPERFGLLPEFAPAIIQLLAMQAHWGFLSYVAMIALVHVTVYVQRAQAEALAREELRTQAVSAQLTALARQMQPHFLFNALNALVAMLDEGSPAQVFTIRLADMLRILLQRGDRATSTLGEELALVEAYLDIERARLGSRLQTDIHIADSVTQCRVPAFILQPLVENAITHGISRILEGGEITVRAQRQAGDIVIEISNTCASGDDEAESVEGMQLALPNCRRRLALLYGASARFYASFVTRNLFRASIILPGDVAAALQPT